MEKGAVGIYMSPYLCSDQNVGLSRYENQIRKETPLGVQ
jgi:hypothetical protein